MLNSASLVNEFLYGLSFLDSYIKLCNKTRLTDINIISEQFVCELLNILYGYNLVNSNEQNGSTAGYDLICESKKIIVQVSSECRANKVVQSLISIKNILRNRDDNFVEISKWSDQLSQREKERQSHEEKLKQCEKKIEEFCGQAEDEKRLAKQRNMLMRDREELQGKIRRDREEIDECKHHIEKCEKYIAKTKDLRGYRVIILFLTVDASNIRKNPRVSESCACEDVVFDQETDILDFASLANRVAKHCIFTETENRLRLFMQENSALFVHKEFSMDRVREIIDDYASNFESNLFLHKYENSLVTLQRLYVPPAFSEICEHNRNFYSKEKNPANKGNSIEKSRDMIGLLCDFLWQKPKNDRERILFIEGHAAIGKTSLVSWICHHYRNLKLEEPKENVAIGKAIFMNRPIVCVRLRELNLGESKTSTEAILNYLKINDIKCFESTYPESIIILDGADELSMVSGTAIGSVEEIILDVRKAFSKHKIIITTRPDFLDMTRFNSSAFSIRRIMLEHYDHEMRIEWIEKYRACGEAISKNTEDYIVSISDSTAIGVADTPLALYLLARCDMRAELQGNQWSLFHEIFANAITKAEYNENFDNFTRSRMSCVDSSVNYRVVANIAYRMFQNSREERYFINKREIDEVICKSDLQELSREQVKKTCVLCAYWKSTSTLGALEFYHNNIRDFFLCEYICEKLRELFCAYGKDLNVDDCSNRLQKLLCEVFCWADINASTWQQTFAFIYLRLKYESIYEQKNDSLYNLIHNMKNLPNVIYRLSISKDLWYHESKEIPYLSAKYVFVNSMLLVRILYEFCTEKECGDCIRVWVSEEEENTWNKMNLLGDWREVLQRQVRISAQESIGIISNTEFGSISFCGIETPDMDFQRCKFTGTRFENAKLIKANFSHSTLRNVYFLNVDLLGANFFKASIHEGVWTNCLNNTDFTNAHIEKLSISNEKLYSLCFDQTVVKESSFQKCEFASLRINQNAEFYDVDFSQTIISGEIKQASLHSCNFHLARFCLDSELNGTMFSQTKLNTVRFEGKLYEIVFKDCDLRNCDFSRVEQIDNVIFENCNLENANFRKIKLSRVFFVDSVLDNASFFQTQMVECTIKGEKTTLRNTIFIGASNWHCELSNANFGEAKLHNAIGFENSGEGSRKDQLYE